MSNQHLLRESAKVASAVVVTAVAPVKGAVVTAANAVNVVSDRKETVRRDHAVIDPHVRRESVRRARKESVLHVHKANGPHVRRVTDPRARGLR